MKILTHDNEPASGYALQFDNESFPRGRLPTCPI
jgi:hypothetical protein